MRPIDADAYAAELWKLRQNYQILDDTHTADMIMHGIFRAEQALKEQPTVDAVQVVRCRACKYWEEESTFCLNKEGCYGSETTADWFCADGERRTDEQ